MRRQGAARIVVSVTGVSRDLLPVLEKEADEVVTLTVPVSLWAVGQLYEEFPQVEDEEVVSLMKKHPAS